MRRLLAMSREADLGLRNSPGRASHGRAPPVPLTPLEVREHRLHVATESFSVRFARFSNFRKHRIKFHRPLPKSSSGVQITGI
jgi:hypothetical protein